MKKIYVFALLLLLGPCVLAAKFHQVKLVFKNGKELQGLARFHQEPAVEFIQFKASAEGEERKISSEELSRLIYFIEGQEPVEYDRLKTWRYNLKKEKVVGPPVWLQVVQRGQATLYATSTEGSVVHSSRGASINPGDTYYFIIRPGEDSGTLIHLQMHTTVMLMKNRLFWKIGADYFKDYQELAEKIAGKSYKAKDLLTVVTAYNQWYKSQS